MARESLCWHALPHGGAAGAEKSMVEKTGLLCLNIEPDAAVDYGTYLVDIRSRDCAAVKVDESELR